MGESDVCAPARDRAPLTSAALPLALALAARPAVAQPLCPIATASYYTTNFASSGCTVDGLTFSNFQFFLFGGVDASTLYLQPWTTYASGTQWTGFWMNAPYLLTTTADDARANEPNGLPWSSISRSAQATFLATAPVGRTFTTLSGEPWTVDLAVDPGSTWEADNHTSVEAREPGGGPFPSYQNSASYDESWYGGNPAPSQHYTTCEAAALVCTNNSSVVGVSNVFTTQMTLVLQSSVTSVGSPDAPVGAATSSLYAVLGQLALSNPVTTVSSASFGSGVHRLSLAPPQGPSVTSSVPEPATVALVGGGLLALAGVVRRRRRV